MKLTIFILTAILAGLIITEHTQNIIKDIGAINVVYGEYSYQKIIKRIEKKVKLVGTASYYDYLLEINGKKIWWSKTHSTCAFRHNDEIPRYSILRVYYKDRYIDCFINDFGPKKYTGRIIDLSSYSFKQLAPLSKGLIEVKIELY